MFPPAALEQVYVRGSLKNTVGGFELVLRNNIDTATLVGIGPVTVDGTAYSGASLSVKTPRAERRGDQLGYGNPLYLPVGTEMHITVQGELLAPGEHRLLFVANVGEIGRVQFEAHDVVA
jgi:hypothetical protein